jgi:predicted transcriptional regulator
MPDDVKPRRPMTEDEFREAVDKGEKDHQEGRTVSHEQVRRWVKSWGTPRELPRPTPKCR